MVYLNYPKSITTGSGHLIANIPILGLPCQRFYLRKGADRDARYTSYFVQYLGLNECLECKILGTKSYSI